MLIRSVYLYMLKMYTYYKTQTHRCTWKICAKKNIYIKKNLLLEIIYRTAFGHDNLKNSWTDINALFIIVFWQISFIFSVYLISIGSLKKNGRYKGCLIELAQILKIKWISIAYIIFKFLDRENNSEEKLNNLTFSLNSFSFLFPDFFHYEKGMSQNNKTIIWFDMIHY